jgi:hypothetical protein
MWRVSLWTWRRVLLAYDKFYKVKVGLERGGGNRPVDYFLLCIDRFQTNFE